MKDVVGVSEDLGCDIHIPLYKQMETLEMLLVLPCQKGRYVPSQTRTTLPQVACPASNLHRRHVLEASVHPRRKPTSGAA